MNMPPPPPQPTAYRACNIALANAAKAVAMKTMKDAANGAGKRSVEGNKPVCVFCDGTWQIRRHSSLNGCQWRMGNVLLKC
jgi:hypothetical protein